MMLILFLLILSPLKLLVLTCCYAVTELWSPTGATHTKHQLSFPEERVCVCVCECLRKAGRCLLPVSNRVGVPRLQCMCGSFQSVQLVEQQHVERHQHHQTDGDRQSAQRSESLSANHNLKMFHTEPHGQQEGRKTNGTKEHKYLWVCWSLSCYRKNPPPANTHRLISRLLFIFVQFSVLLETFN